MARRFNPGGSLDQDYLRLVLPSAISAYPLTIAACFARELDDGVAFHTIAQAGTAGSNNSRHIAGIPASTDVFRASSGDSAGTFRSANTSGALTNQKWYVGVARFVSTTSRTAQRTGAALVSNSQSAVLGNLDELSIARKGISAFESFPGWLQWVTYWKLAISTGETTELCENWIDPRRVSPELILAHVDLTERKPVVHSARHLNLVFEMGGDPAWTTYVPYTIPIKRRRIFVPTGAAGIEGDLAATEAQDVAAITGDVVSSGDLSATDPADTAQVLGDVIAAGDLGASEGPDVAAIAGDVLAAGELVATDPQDTAAIAGDILAQGSLITTEAADVAAIVGDILAQGDLDATEAQDEAHISGGQLATGSMDATDPIDGAQILGDVKAAGSLNVSEAPDVAAFEGDVLAAGDLLAIETADTAAITGTSLGPTTGDLEALETPDACAIAGEVEVRVSVADAIARIKARQVAKAAMLDKHGAFVKRPPGLPLDHVNLEFDDGAEGTISAADYNRLTKADKDEIHNSGALPQELLP